MTDAASGPLEARMTEALDRDRPFLWGLCYRLTGSAADADDLVQDTLVRALERPPRNLERPLRPWLARVASRLALDTLRSRKARRTDLGCFLPEPLPERETAAGWDGRARPTDAEARYSLAESASFAFLVALEALTPLQRAVVVVRDVLGHGVDETAELLDTTPGAVKTAHHRARHALSRYDARRVAHRASLADAQRNALARLFAAIQGRLPPEALAQLFAEDVRSISDGGDGVVSAARRVVSGRDTVARLIKGLVDKSGPPAAVVPVIASGEPALLTHHAARGRRAATSLYRLDIDPVSGVITDLHGVLDPRKLARLQAALP